MPASATDTYAASGLQPLSNPEEFNKRQIHVPLADGTYVKGQVLGEVTATGKYDGYTTAGADGTEVARGILVYACTVASGLVSYNDGSGVTYPSAPMYYGGGGCKFKASDLTDLDAAALVDLNGHTIADETDDVVVI